eukprot:2167539-Heterocapsa_arctica.AAC.1
MSNAVCRDAVPEGLAWLVAGTAAALRLRAEMYCGCASVGPTALAEGDPIQEEVCIVRPGGGQSAPVHDELSMQLGSWPQGTGDGLRLIPQ